MGPAHRHDIDGLRGLAVSGVLLYHFGAPGFSGGYVGVDVFFVLSGYLMMTLVHRDLQSGRFSIASFYERRIRRIVPAFAAMLLGTLLSGFILLFPIQLVSLAKTAIAAALFGSNVAFWWRTGYFDQSADRMPLLHTWSLSVEAQFYVCFPLLLIFVARKLSGRHAAALWNLAAASFLVSLWSTAVAPQAAFFLLPSRLWELLAGAIVAVHTRQTPARRGYDWAVALAGVALIAVANGSYSMSTPFPGAAALLPCVGTAMVLATGAAAPTVVHRVLAWGPLAWLGTISYSLYLWHWPIYLLTRHALARPVTPRDAIWLAASSIGIAALSWRYVEQPARKPDSVLPRRRFFVASGAGLGVTAALALAAVAWGGLPGRFDSQTIAILSVAPPEVPCVRPTMPNADLGAMCGIGNPAAQPSFVLWGDSHAAALVPAIERAAAVHGLGGEFSWLGDCPPLLGLERARWSEPSCQARNVAMIRYLRDTGITHVILGARWASGLEIVGDPAGRVHLSWQYDTETRERSIDENRRVFRRSLERTLAALHDGGHIVTIVAPVPESQYPVPDMMARRRLQGRRADEGPTLADFEARNRFVFDAFRHSSGAATYVFPHQLLCADGPHCALSHDDRPLYSDHAHLSPFGAKRISVLFDPLFESIARGSSR